MNFEIEFMWVFMQMIDEVIAVILYFFYLYASLGGSAFLSCLCVGPNQLHFVALISLTVS